MAKGIDGNALYSIKGGYNDMFTQFDLLQAGQITAAQLQANVGLAATQLAQQVGILKANGANYIVVFNTYDWGKSPYGTVLRRRHFGAVPPSRAVQQHVQCRAQPSRRQRNRVNVQALAQRDAGQSGSVRHHQYDGSGLRRDAVGTVHAGQPRLLERGEHLPVRRRRASHYRGNEVIAQTVASMIEGPMQMVALGEAPLAVEQANFRALDDRMWSNVNSAPTNKKFNAWAAYDYGTNDILGTGLSGSADLNTLTVGGDVRMSDSMVIGMAAGYTENKSDFDNGTGDFKLTETTGSVYAGYGTGPWYVGLSMLVGDLDYDVKRNITLGAGTRTESGGTGGWTYALRLLGGYWFNTSSGLVHGPFAKVAYQDIIVRAFSETGSSSTGLRYNQQERESLQTSLGWQVAGKIGQVRPWARVTWEYDSMADQRSVEASSLTLGGTYTVPGFTPDDNWIQYQVGAAMDFGGVTGFISGSGTGSKNDGNGYGVTVGLRVPL